ncbi:MAG: PqqD family protein [Candidatus Omnitrophota bacterium]
MKKIKLESVYVPSEDVVSRELEGEFIIIPIVSGIGDSDNDFFSLNETGRAIWSKMNGKMNLKKIAQELAKEFDAPVETIEKDVVGLVGELLKKKMLREIYAK